MKAVPRIGLRRTQAVDDILSGIWQLRPELKRKITITVLLGLESFFRECKAQAQTVHAPSGTVTSTSDEGATVAELESATEAKRDSTVSDDIEW